MFVGQPRGGEWAVYAINPDGTGLTRLVEVWADPFVSPDGRRIALVGTGGIVVVDADGGGRRRLVRAWQVGGIAWSPDGTRIAYSDAPMPYPDEEYAPGRLYVVPIDGSGRQLVAEGAANVTWSSDGRWIAYDTLEGIVVARADGRDPRLITPSGMGRAPTWSPRGSRIAFLHCRDVYVVNADGSGMRRVASGWSGDGLSIDGPTDVYNLRWSPDGMALAFVRRASGVEHLFFVRADGSGERRLTRAWDGDPDAIAWSPDGRQIAVSRGTGSRSNLLVMNADGSNRHALTADFDFAQLPGWRAGRLPRGPLTAHSVLLQPSHVLEISGVGRLSAAGPRAALLPPEPHGQCGRILVWNGVSGTKRSLPGFDCHPSDAYVDAELGGDRLAVLAGYYLPMSGEEDYLVLVRRLDRPRPALKVAEAFYDYTDETGATLDNLVAGGDLVAFNRSGDDPVPSVLRQRGREMAKPIGVSGVVLSVDGGRILVRAGGGLVVVDAGGRRLRAMPGAPQAKLQGRNVVALDRGVLRIYDVTTGRLRRSWRVVGVREPVRLADVHGGVAAYLRQGRLNLLLLRDGRSIAVRLPGAERLRDVALEEDGLFYAGPREVGFVRRGALLRAVG